MSVDVKRGEGASLARLVEEGVQGELTPIM